MLGTFYYMWYTRGSGWHNWSECINPDPGNVSDCHNLGKDSEVYNCPGTNDHNPPNRWAGRYLPTLSGTTDNNTELYSSQDSATIKKQLTLMKYAGIEFLICSWWGQGTESDSALSVLKSVLESDTNPYPEVKFCIYYEKDGYSPPPSESTVRGDVDYIRTNFTTSTYYMKISSKPVFWVYNRNGTSSENTTMTDKWYNIRTRTGKEIYVVLKQLTGWDGNLASKADSWHEYAPAVRYLKTGSYSSFVSPGFYRYHACERLARSDRHSYTDFENAISQMKDDNVTFKTIQTWNEWQECSGVEPAVEINHIEGGSGAFTVKGTPYNKAYLDIIKKYFNPTTCTNPTFDFRLL